MEEPVSDNIMLLSSCIDPTKLTALVPGIFKHLSFKLSRI